MARTKKMRLGEMLVEGGVITEEQLSQALKEKRSDQKLGDKLIEDGYITEAKLVEVLKDQLGINDIRLTNYEIDPNILNLIPKDYVIENNIIPIKREKNKLYIATADPLDYFVLNDLRLLTGFIIEPLISTKDEIRHCIIRLYEREDFGEYFLAQEEESEVQDITIAEANSPIVKIINQLIQQAVVEKASDIHFDPHENKVIARLRVDGTLRTEQVFAKGIQSSLVTRIKIMANLDITESKVPQDGRIKVRVEGRNVDLRVSTLPTIYGEKIVIRVLDTIAVSNRLNDLGFDEDHLNQFIEMIEKPHGIVLLTGPTGSGKTSTMYAALSRLNKPDVNIITVEDPVEYQLEGVNQIQVNPKVGLTFASGLRSILRQDPDIIMIGEIRDKDTANMAVRASITGHLVLSTLHTNHSLGAIDRLMNMGVEKFLIGSSLNGVVAQRLVRRICRDCAIEKEPTNREKLLFEKHNIVVERTKKGQGCPSCNMTGYRGRTAIHEVLFIDDDLREAILNDESTVSIERLAREKGFRRLIEDGLKKVAEGITTTEEVFRVATE